MEWKCQLVMGGQSNMKLALIQGWCKTWRTWETDWFQENYVKNQRELTFLGNKGKTHGGKMLSHVKTFSVFCKTYFVPWHVHFWRIVSIGCGTSITCIKVLIEPTKVTENCTCFKMKQIWKNVAELSAAATLLHTQVYHLRHSIKVLSNV